MNNHFNVYTSPDGGDGGGGGDAGNTGGTILGGAGDQGTQGAGAGAGEGGGKGDGDGQSSAYFTGLYDSTGALNKGNFDNLPEHLTQYRSIYDKYDTVDALFGALGNASTLVGKKGLMPLPEGADDNAKAEFGKRLDEVNRVPEDPKSYGIQRPDSVREDLWDQGYADKAAEMFKAHHIGPDAAKALMAMEAEHAVEIDNARIAAQESYVNEQRKMIANDFGANSGRKLAAAQQVAKSLGIDLQDQTLGNSAALIIGLSRVSDMVGEDRFGGDDGTGQTKGNAEQAQDIITNPANPEHAIYQDRNHPLHNKVVAKVTELNRLASAKR